jgi:hypothetical protein
MRPPGTPRSNLGTPRSSAASSFVIVLALASTIAGTHAQELIYAGPRLDAVWADPAGRLRIQQGMTVWTPSFGDEVSSPAPAPGTAPPSAPPRSLKLPAGTRLFDLAPDLVAVNDGALTIGDQSCPVDKDWARRLESSAPLRIPLALGRGLYAGPNG